MSLISDIQSIISTIAPDATQILSSKFNANVTSFTTDSIDFPLIIIDNEISKNSEIKKNNNIHKDTKIIISIYSLDLNDNNDSQSQSLCDNAEDKADLIAAKIYQLLPVRPKSNQTYKITPMYRVFNTMLTGVSMEMQIIHTVIVNF